MITLEHVKIYQKYQGDIDGLARCGTDEEKKILNDANFRVLEKLIQNACLIKRDLVAESFIEKNENDLKSHCDDLLTIEQIKLIACRR